MLHIQTVCTKRYSKYNNKTLGKSHFRQLLHIECRADIFLLMEAWAVLSHAE